MLAYLQKVFRVLPEESAKLLTFALLAALLQAGIAIGFAAADSMFVSYLTVEKLPLVYMFMPVVMALYAPVYSILLARFGTDRLFQLAIAALVVGGLFFGFGADWFGEATPWVLFAMKFYVGLWFIALYTLFWNFTDDYFSILDSKRLYGLIAAGGSAGAMLGASLVLAFTAFLPPSKLFLAWALLALLTAPLLLRILKRFRKIETEDLTEVESGGPLRLLAFIFDTFRTSRFALALALICFCAVFLTSILEYLSLGVFSQGKNPTELAVLLGQLYATANAFTLVINLFFFSRLVGYLGVNTTALILPLTYLTAFVFFFLNHGFLAALVAFYAYQSCMTGVEYNNVNLLYNALPVKVKRHLRAFIEAMCEPVATAAAGAFLYFCATPLGTENLALFGVFATTLTLGVAFLLRNDYVLALAKNLRADWLNFAQPEQNWLSLIQPADHEILREKARSASRDQQILAVDLLWRIDDSEARPALLNLVSTATPAEMDYLRPAVTQMLRREDTKTLAETLLWLESEHSPDNPEILDQFTATGAIPVRRLHDWKSSEHPAHVAISAVAHWHSSRLEDTSGALDRIHRLLEGDPASRLWAIRAIGDFRHSRHAPDILRFLAEPSPAIRLETLRALRKLASPDSSSLLEHILPLVDAASPEERHLILEIAERIGDTAAVSGLILAAQHFSSAESRQLETLVVNLGLKTIPTVIHLLRNPSAPYHSRSVAARALSRLAIPQLQLISSDIIDTELSRARDYVAAYHSLAAASQNDSDGLRVLCRFYHDIAVEGLEFALELLSLVGVLPDFDLIKASLALPNPKEQANAIETIQQSCNRALFEKIRPLIEAAVQTNGLARSLRLELLPVETILRQATSSQNALECASGFLAFRDLGLVGALDLLRARLDHHESPRLMEWLVALLPRFDRDPATPTPFEVHPVERVSTLVRANLFRDARIFALDYLACNAVEQLRPAGEIIYEVGTSTDTLYVVAEGEVQVSRGTKNWTVTAGRTFGERALMGDPGRRERAVSAGSRVLTLPAHIVGRAIEIFPALGISLYKFKTVSAVE